MLNNALLGSAVSQRRQAAEGGYYHHAVCSNECRGDMSYFDDGVLESMDEAVLLCYAYGSGREPVAARLGEQVARPGRLALQLAAQLRQVHPQVVALRLV